MTQPEMLRVFLKALGYYLVVVYGGAMPGVIYGLTHLRETGDSDQIILSFFMSIFPNLFPFVAGFVLLFATRSFVNLAYPEVREDAIEEGTGEKTEA